MAPIIIHDPYGLLPGRNPHFENDPAINANPQRDRRVSIQAVFQKSLLVLTTAATIVSCIPHCRTMGTLATRSISLLSTTTSNVNRLKNGSLTNRAAAITKIAGVSLGLAGVATSTPMLIIASLTADTAFQTFEAIQALRQDDLTGFFHLGAVAVNILMLSATVVCASSGVVLALSLTACVINATAMVGLAGLSGVNRSPTGVICYAALVILSMINTIVLVIAMDGKIIRGNYKLAAQDGWFKDSDEVQWKFCQVKSHHKYGGQYETIRTGVAHKGDILEFEVPTNRIEGTLIVESGNSTFVNNLTFAQHVERINVPTPQEMATQQIPTLPFMGPAIAFEQDVALLGEDGIPQRDNNDDPHLYTIDVHARDTEREIAVRLLAERVPMHDQEEVRRNVRAFKTYLNNLPDSLKKRRAQRALEGDNVYRDEYGPMLPGQSALIARLWHFSDTYTPPPGQGVNVNREREMARDDMVLGLSRCFNPDGRRVCDPGKVARLVVAVLQGRLSGVNIDRVPIPINGDTSVEFVITDAMREQAIQQLATAAINEFFAVEANRTLEEAALIKAAETFIGAKPGIDREEFLKQIADYLCNAGAENQHILGVPPAGNIFQRRWEASTKIQTAWRARTR